MLQLDADQPVDNHSIKFLLTVLLLFVDLFQVRLQTMPQPEPGQKPMFTGTVDCALKTVRKEVRLKSKIRSQK